MKVHEKLKQIRQSRKLKLVDIHEKLNEIFPNEISYTTLRRIESGESSKITHLQKVCTVLGISLTELFKGTDSQNNMIVRKNQRVGEYYFNEKVIGGIISTPASTMFSLEVTFEPHSQTVTERTTEERDIEKIIYIMSGTLDCFIGDETYTLNSKDSLVFKAHIPHHFENNYAKKCMCIITENKKRF